jgi:hypothetical protein
MAVPLTPAVTATQIAQQKAADQAGQAGKGGPSKFDQAMAQQTPQAQGVQAATEVQNARPVQQVLEVGKLDPTRPNKVNASAPAQGSNTLSARAVEPVAGKQETNKLIASMTSMVSEMEKGQGLLDKLISGGLKGVKFSNTQLLSLQAGMYKYTQELDLTGKVVDKATSGLKDTLKTQV